MAGIDCMNDKQPTSHRATQEVETARDFYSDLGLSVDYFSALWHSLTVGHMMLNDLDRISRLSGLSLADFNLLGALCIDSTVIKRATDLAVTLQVTNASLSARIDRLANQGLLEKSPDPNDRRAHLLRITDSGKSLVIAIHQAIETESHFVQCVRQLEPEDRAALERILGNLHGLLDRNFLHVHR